MMEAVFFAVMKLYDTIYKIFQCQSGLMIKADFPKFLFGLCVEHCSRAEHS